MEGHSRETKHGRETQTGKESRGPLTQEDQVPPNELGRLIQTVLSSVHIVPALSTALVSSLAGLQLSPWQSSLNRHLVNPLPLIHIVQTKIRGANWHRTQTGLEMIV